MPAITCPKCEFALTYLDDLIGVLRCPGCGEDILHGREEPRWVEDAPEPHVRRVESREAQHVPLEEDTEEDAAQFTDDEPLPGVDVADRPAGIFAAGAVWILAGVLGLAANVPLLVLLAVANRGGRAEDGLSLPGMVLLGAGLAATAAAFYVAIVRAARGFQRGAYPHVQLPAWFVLLASGVLLVVNTRYGLAQPWPPLAAAWLTLAGVDVLLFLASVVLLWQSADYAHWARAAITRRATSADRRDYPGSVAFAARSWLAIGLIAAGFTGALAYQAAEEPSRLVLAELAGLALLGGLVLGLGTLLGRLSSTRITGVVFLGVALAVLGWALYTWATLPDTGTRDPFELPRLSCLVATALCGLGLVASVAAMVGDAAYRNWLRIGRGLHV